MRPQVKAVLLCAGIAVLSVGVACQTRGESPPSEAALTAAPPRAEPVTEAIPGPWTEPLIADATLRTALEDVCSYEPSVWVPAARKLIACGGEAAPFLAQMAGLVGAGDPRAHPSRHRLIEILRMCGPAAIDDYAWLLVRLGPDHTPPQQWWQKYPMDALAPEVVALDPTDGAVHAAIAKQLGDYGTEFLDSACDLLRRRRLDDAVQGELERKLSSENDLVVLAAATVLGGGTTVSTEAAARLAELTRHEWPRMRTVVARALGLATSSRDVAVPALAPLLASDTYKVRGAAVMAISNFEDLPASAAPALLDLLEYPLELPRACAVRALAQAELPSEDVKQAIALLARAEDDPGVRLVAIAAQGAMRGERAKAMRTVLDELSTGPRVRGTTETDRWLDPNVARVALGVLGQDGMGELVSHIATESDQRRVLPATCIGLMGDVGIDAVVNTLTDDGFASDHGVALPPWPIDRADDLIGLMQAPDDRVRQAAANCRLLGAWDQSFGTWEPRPFIPDHWVITGQHAPSREDARLVERIRVASLAVTEEESGRSTDHRFVHAGPPTPDALMTALTTGTDHSRRAAATGVFRRDVWSEYDYSALAPLLSDANLDTRVAAASILARQGDLRAVAVVLDALEAEPDSHFLEDCIASLTRPGRHLPRVLAVLRHRIEASPTSTHESTQRCVAALGPDAAPLIDTIIDKLLGPEGMRAGPQLLASIGQPAVDELLLRLSDADSDTQVTICGTLAAMGPVAVGAIDRMAGYTDYSQPVGQAADRAENALRNWAETPTPWQAHCTPWIVPVSKPYISHLRRGNWESFGGSMPNVPELEEHLRSEYPAVRSNAIHVLTRYGYGDLIAEHIEGRIADGMAIRSPFPEHTPHIRLGVDGAYLAPIYLEHALDVNATVRSRMDAVKELELAGYAGSSALDGLDQLGADASAPDALREAARTAAQAIREPTGFSEQPYWYSWARESGTMMSAIRVSPGGPWFY